MSKNENPGEEGLFALAIFLLGIIAVMVRLFTLTKLWLWFIVPTFHVQPISLTMAYGLTLFLGLIAYPLMAGLPRKEEPTSKEAQAVVGIVGVGIPLLSLAIGWGVTQFLPLALEATK